MPVPTEINGETHLDQQEAIKYMGISRETFRAKEKEWGLIRHGNEIDKRKVLYRKANLEAIKRRFHLLPLPENEDENSR